MLNYFIQNNAIHEENVGGNNGRWMLFMEAYFVLKAHSSTAFKYLLQRYRVLKGGEGFTEFEVNVHNLFNNHKKIVIK